MEFTYQPGQTPLDPDEKEGLKPKHISTQGELNEWEQLNIIKRARWAQRQLKQDILDELAARFHHQLVLIHPFPNGNGRCCRLIVDLLLQKMGLEPFTWGSGGHTSLVSQSEMRAEYLAALRAADQGDISPLLAFARK